VGLIFSPKFAIIEIYRKETMLGYTLSDVQNMIHSIDIAMTYMEEYHDREEAAILGLVDTASLLEGLIAEGHI
jgi:hypothetical protein